MSRRFVKRNKKVKNINKNHEKKLLKSAKAFFPFFLHQQIFFLQLFLCVISPLPSPFSFQKSKQEWWESKSIFISPAEDHKSFFTFHLSTELLWLGRINFEWRYNFGILINCFMYINMTASCHFCLKLVYVSKNWSDYGFQLKFHLAFEQLIIKTRKLLDILKTKEVKLLNYCHQMTLLGIRQRKYISRY